MPSTRLSPDHWIAAGLKALVAHGPAMLRAESLARLMGTTKGSFYWHFADVPAFHAAVLECWENAALAELKAVEASDEQPVQKLRHMAQAVGGDALEGVPAGVEPALRAWARDHAGAASALSRMDARRMKALGELLTASGLTNSELARIVYGAHIGMAELSGRDGTNNETALGTLVDLILALYE